MRVGILEHFDAGHHLPGHPTCGRPHGHTYRVEVIIRGETIDASGTLYPLDRLQDVERIAVACFDLFGGVGHGEL